MSSTGAGSGGGRPEALALADDVAALYDAHGEAPLFGLSVEQLLELLELEETITRRRDGWVCQLVRELDGRNVAAECAATGTADLLRHRLLMRPAEAHTRVRVAKALHSKLPATGAALAAGELSFEHAQVIVSATGRIDSTVPWEIASQVEEDLINQAADLDPGQLRTYARHLLAWINPDPDDDEQRRVAAQSLSWREREDGMTDVRGTLAAENAALLEAALDPLAAPRPGIDGQPDPRSPGRRRADALGELCRRALDGGTLPAQGGVRPHVMVLIPWDTLRGFGTTPGQTVGTGTPLPRSVLDRIVCDSAVRRIVLDPKGQPIDVGRAQRTVPPAIRAAVIARDKMCTYPGCDRPPGWNDVHHLHWWTRGGETSLANSALACSFHHDLLHHGGYKIRLGPSSGRIEWQAPAWISPGGEWKSNPIAAARDPYQQAHTHTAQAQTQARDADARAHPTQAQARDTNADDWAHTAQARDDRTRAAHATARDTDDRGRDGPDP